MAMRNYKVWRVSSEKFSDNLDDVEKLLYFARYAILAPSGHNSQPWELKVKRASLEVRVNQDHFLSADGSGLLSAEPYISVGTFLEVFVLAAQGFGYQVAVNPIPGDKKVAELHIERKITARPSLLKAIVRRTSNRNSFKQVSIDQKILKDISASDLSGVKSTLITHREDIEFMAGQTETAIASIMGKPEYRTELSEWVRTNQTLKYDGMPGFTHGFGNLKSLLSKAAIKYGPKHGPEAKKSAELIRNSGALVIVHSEDNQKQSFVSAGRLFSRIFILAYENNLAASALGASVLDAGTREQVKKRFKIAGRPLYVLRLGKPTVSAPHSPRWPLEKVLAE